MISEKEKAHEIANDLKDDLDAQRRFAEARLLACPWCGGEASSAGRIKYSSSHEAWWQDGTKIREAYYVNCMRCTVTNQGLLGHQTLEKAITHWNTRKQANE